MAGLLEAYIRGDADLLASYAGAPTAVRHHAIPVRSWEAALAAEMTAYQHAIGSDAAFAGNEGVIITGQQPGIFTGPLYTIYKAITAIRLAADLQQAAGAPIAPIYWVGGDDHDYDEIRRVHLLSKTHTSVPIALDALPGQGACSVFQRPVPDALHDLADEAARQAPGSEFTEEIRAFLHESLEASANLSEWHARLMARLFRGTPLVFFTPELPAARAAAMPVFEREIRQPLASTAQVNTGGAALAAAGYGAQVVKAEDACNFFLESRGMRCRVRFDGGQFILPDTGETFSEAEMLALLARSPELFTANVALRCIVQQHLFPVRAYVAGPGELAYWGQLKGLFAQFEQPMPIVYPRIRAVLTSMKTNKLLRKFELTPVDLQGNLPDVEERALRASQQDPALGVLERRRAELLASVDAMEAEFRAMGRGGSAALGLAGQFRGQMQQGLDHLERSLLRADAARTETVRSQIARLSTELAPERKPQERYYTLFSWLFQHGWGLVPRLMASLDHRDFSLQEVEL